MSDTVTEPKPTSPKADEWAERIAAQQRSGTSVKQFCKEQGLTEYSFYAWRKRLQETGPVRFALVDRDARRQDRAAEAPLELVLGNGERLIKGKTIGVDSTTLEANAAMKSIVRRDNGESYNEYLKRVATAEGVQTTDTASPRRMDRKRKKKTSNEDWTSPSDAEAEITKLKDGRTALAYKAENAVDMETGAIVAVTTHGGAAADTATVAETVIEAGAAVAGLVAETTLEGNYPVHPDGVEEVVADKGYHSNDVAVALRDLAVRTYIAEPERGERNWNGKAAEKKAVYANRRRVRGEHGKGLQRRRGDARGKSIVFSAVFKFPPDASGRSFLTKVKAAVESAGFQWRDTLFTGAHNH